MFLRDHVVRGVLAVGALALASLAGCTTAGSDGSGTRAAPIPAGGFGLGRAPTAEQIRAWDIAIGPDGANLPAGSGSVAQGRDLYVARCAVCHGAKGEGKPGPQLSGGNGTLKAANPVVTIGSFWPYATTLYDYIFRSMPLDKPQTLTPNEVYALTAFLLNLNGIVGADAVMDARMVPAVRMPNAAGFKTVDGSPDIRATRCMENCKP